MKIASRDIFTAANGVTVIGLILTIIGSTKLNTLNGLLLVGLGRALDLVDGPIARMTHTSGFSSLLDPIADKIALLFIIIGALYYDLVPGLIVSYVFVYNLLITILSVAAFKKGTAERALVPGKLNLFCQIAGILFFIAGTVMTSFNDLLIAAGYVSILVSLPFAAAAIKAYSALARR